MLFFFSMVQFKAYILKLNFNKTLLQSAQTMELDKLNFSQWYFFCFAPSFEEYWRLTAGGPHCSMSRTSSV